MSNLHETTEHMIIRIVTSEHAPLSLLLTADPSINHIQEYLHSGVVFVAEEDNHIIATAVLETTETTTEIHNVAVAETHQRRGLGRQLLAHLIDYARTSGAHRLEVGTGNSSLSQLAFYQRCGFRITGIISGFFDSYDPPIIEDGIPCRDMIRLALDLT